MSAKETMCDHPKVSTDITDGIRDDGTVADRPFETYYHRLRQVSFARGYACFIGAGGPYDVEIRVPTDVLRQLMDALEKLDPDPETAS